MAEERLAGNRDSSTQRHVAMGTGPGPNPNVSERDSGSVWR